MAEYLNLSEKTVRILVYRRSGIGLLAFHVGKALRWDWNDIDAFVQEQKEARPDAA
ncbi:DNA-binding protein [Streptomyces sp. CA-106131]|uniref:DNA-binding protein n=1 Tax=Streptomyces sp. CA-106131 TaxID=3240045 RepID=UPI003D93DC71